MMIRYTKSARKRGYSDADVECVIYGEVASESITTVTGTSGRSVLGFTRNAELINVRYQRDSATGDLIVFHVQRAPPEMLYRML